MLIVNVAPAVDSHGIHWAAITSAAVASVLVGATVALAVVTAKQIRLTRETLDVNRAIAREAVHARMDQRGPRVVPYPGHVYGQVWEPSVIGGEPNELTGAAAQWRLPREGGRRLFVRAEINLRNEGAATASTRITTSTSVGSFRTVDTTAPENASALSLTESRGLRLHPGDICFAVIELECSAREWLDHSPITARVDVVAGDLFQEGVEDQIPFELIAAPLQMDPDDAGRAILRPMGDKARLDVGSVLRRYRGN